MGTANTLVSVAIFLLAGIGVPLFFIGHDWLVTRRYHRSMALNAAVERHPAGRHR